MLARYNKQTGMSASKHSTYQDYLNVGWPDVQDGHPILVLTLSVCCNLKQLRLAADFWAYCKGFCIKCCLECACTVLIVVVTWGSYRFCVEVGQGVDTNKCFRKIESSLFIIAMSVWCGWARIIGNHYRKGWFSWTAGGSLTGLFDLTCAW